MFDDVGDRVDWESLQRLELSAIDIDSNEWGLALMRLNYFLPRYATPGPNHEVSIFFIGGVAIGHAPIASETTASNGNLAQDFYFTSTDNDAVCDGAPSGGIIVQAQAVGESYAFRVNDVDVVLATPSTIYLQAQPDGALSVNVLEGVALLKAHGEEVGASMGSLVRVPLDNRGVASDVPSPTEPMTESGPIPTQLLHRETPIPEPVSLEDIAFLGSEAPTPGIWTYEWQSRDPDPDCRPPTLGRDVVMTYDLDFQVHMNGTVLSREYVDPGLFIDDPDPERRYIDFYTASQPGVYGHAWLPGEWAVVSPDHMLFTLEGHGHNEDGSACTETFRADVRLKSTME